MALPLGHAMFGLACYQAVAPNPGRPLSDQRRLAIASGVVLVSILPDADWLAYLWAPPEIASNFRHTLTHGVLFAALIGLLFWVRLTREEGWRSLLAWFAVAWGHGVLDVFYADPRPLKGVALFSPFFAQSFFWPIFPEAHLQGLASLLTSPYNLTFQFVEATAGLVLFSAVWLARQLITSPAPWSGHKVTPVRFVALRLYNVSLGSFPVGARLLRRVLLALLVRKRASGETYCQSAEFFCYDQMGSAEGSAPPHPDPLPKGDERIERVK